MNFICVYGLFIMEIDPNIFKKNSLKLILVYTFIIFRNSLKTFYKFSRVNFQSLRKFGNKIIHFKLKTQWEKAG